MQIIRETHNRYFKKIENLINWSISVKKILLKEFCHHRYNFKIYSRRSLTWKIQLSAIGSNYRIFRRLAFPSNSIAEYRVSVCLVFNTCLTLFNMAFYSKFAFVGVLNQAPGPNPGLNTSATVLPKTTGKLKFFPVSEKLACLHRQPYWRQLRRKSGSTLLKKKESQRRPSGKIKGRWEEKNFHGSSIIESEKKCESRRSTDRLCCIENDFQF